MFYYVRWQSLDATLIEINFMFISDSGKIKKCRGPSI